MLPAEYWDDLVRGLSDINAGYGHFGNMESSL